MTRTAETLGQRLALARGKRGLTQEGLAELSGVKQSDISKLETGRSHTTTGIARLARALRVPDAWLELGEGDEPNWDANADPVTDSTERDDRDDLASAVHWLAELLQAASPLARKAAAPVLAGIAESPDTWHEAADMLATLLGSQGTGDAPNAETGRTIAVEARGGREWRRKAGTQPQEASKQSSRRRRA